MKRIKALTTKTSDLMNHANHFNTHYTKSTRIHQKLSAINENKL